MHIDLTIANGENAASGNGLDKSTAAVLLRSGIDVITSGNHIWQKREMQEYIDETLYSASGELSRRDSGERICYT